MKGSNFLSSHLSTVISENSPCGICIINPDRKIVDINSVAKKFYRMKSKSEIIGMKIFRFVDKSYRKQANIIFDQVLTTGKSKINEVLLINSQNKKLWVECKISLYKDKQSNESFLIQYFRDISEKKEMDDFLLKEKNKYEQLYENLNIGLYKINPAGELIYANSAFANILDFKNVDEIYNKSLTDILRDLKYPRKEFLRLLKKKKSITGFETQLTLPNGKIRYLRESAKLIFNKDKKILGIEGSVEDISDKVLFTSKLKESEESYKGLFNSIQEAVYIQDREGRFLDVNDGALKMYGYSKKAFIGNTPAFLSARNKNDFLKLSAQIENAFKGVPQEFEFWGRRKNGEIFPKNVRLYKGKYFGIDVVIALAQDITQNKLQENKIQRYQKLLSGISNAVQKLLTVEDFEQSLIQTLEILTKALNADRGYVFENSIDAQSGELLMNQIYEWVEKGIEPQINNPLLQKLSYKMVGFDKNDFYPDVIINLRVKKLSGFIKEILESQSVKSLVVVPIFVNKLFWGYFGFDSCKEEQILDEDEKQILKAAAISIGKAIEREMIKNELIAAKNDAQKADRLKTEFLAQISHEIRSPLNIIINYSTLLKEYFDENSDPDIFEMFNGIDSAGKRIIRTIDLILNLAELQTNSYDFAPKEFDLFEDVLQMLIIEYRNNAKKKKIDLEFSLNTDNAKVFVDEYSISQVFANLLDNAIKYTEKGKISVNINRNKNNELCVEISDTGIGISEEYLPNLFMPFRQEEQGYSRKYEGNGLGLSLVKKYCELNNADISVKSSKGNGTKFTVTFREI
jgi:PAS domain S-box-containing protein